MIRPPRRLPFPLQRVKELWHLRRFGTATDEEALALRLAYANLHSVFAARFPRSRIQGMARASRASLRRTQFELLRPITSWGGFALLGRDHLEEATAGRRGALIVSFHLGPYRFIPLELAHQGHLVDIVVDRRGTEREGGILQFFFEERKSAALDREGRFGFWRADLLERLGVINAEEPDCALRIARALQSGRLVMVYLDGNTGAGAKRAAHLQEVTFFGAPIFVRAGLAEIAKVTKAKVVLALSWRRLLRRHVCRFYPPIGAEAGEARPDFSRRLFGTLMARLEERLARQPGDWEEWHHLHRMQDPQRATAATAARAVTEPAASARAGAATRLAVDSYRAFAVSERGAHFVFEPERRRFVTVSPLAAELVRALYHGRSQSALVGLFPTHDPALVLREVERLRSRGWVEARP